MATAKSFAELNKLLKQKIAQAMSEDRLGKDMVDETKQHIRDDIYNSYTPDEYSRTGEFENSVISTSPTVSNDGIRITIKHDPNLMNLKAPWYHQSVVDGSDIREALPEIIHNGLTYDLWNHGDRNYLKPRPYMNNVYRQLSQNKKHVKKLVKHLRDMGLNAIEK